MCGTLDSISSALGTDGSGGGLLGGVSEVLNNPIVKTAIEAGLIYETGGALMATQAGVEAGVASTVGQTITTDALAASIPANTTTLAGIEAASAGAGATYGGLSAGAAMGAAASGAGAGWTSNQILGAGSLASGVLGMAGAGAGAKAGASAADPFASQRPQYQAQLSALMADPNTVMPNTPGYQAGLQATERADAAQGFAGGGRAATDIAAYSSDFYNKQVGILSGLAGATSGSPGTAGSLVAQGATNQQSALNTLMTGASLLWGK